MPFRIRLTEALERLCHILAGVAIVVALLITIVDVVGRNTLGHGIRGVVDLVGLCIVISTMFGIALAWSKRAHIVVDLLDMTGSPALLTFLDVLSRVVGIVTMPLLMWLGYREFLDMVEFGDRTPDLDIPLYWFWLVILVGYGLSALLLLIAPPPEKTAHV